VRAVDAVVSDVRGARHVLRQLLHCADGDVAPFRRDTRGESVRARPVADVVGRFSCRAAPAVPLVRPAPESAVATLSGGTSRNAVELLALQDYHVPIVLIGRPITHVPWPSVSIDIGASTSVDDFPPTTGLRGHFGTGLSLAQLPGWMWAG